jgi:ACS family hexuronate transporter-like MFS transporter
MRWYICGLLFFATTTNYIDRQVLGLLKPTISRDLHWTEADFGWIISSFQAAYAIMMPLAGRLVDWIGPKRGYAIAVIFWTVAAMSHSLARNVFQFAMARFGLGLGESANFPAALRTVADWFPQEERALATGLFNSGTNIGALVAPLAIPWITIRFGWRPAFLFTSGLVLIWLILWFASYRHPPASVARADAKPAARIPYMSLLRERRTWAYLTGKFLTDPVWWFYLYWLPGFLDKNFGLKLAAMGAPIVAVYLLADVGSVAGGWFSSAMLKHGLTPNRARKIAMLACAIAVTGSTCVPLAKGNLWLTVGLVGLAAGAHQGWSANLFTLPSDLFPQEAVGSVVGLGGLGGAISGALVAPMVGYWLDFSHDAYGPLFVVAGSMYLIALGLIHLMVPNLEQRLD